MNTNVTTDFHSHILPGADHGSSSVSTSIRQLEIMAKYGIKRAVATPHFYPMRDNVDVFLRRREKCVSDLKEKLTGGHPEICLGAEVLVCEGMEAMEGLEKLTIVGTNCMLLEMPLTAWSQRLLETVDALVSSGIRVVAAHIDRYPQREVERLLELPLKAQLNPGAFFGMKKSRAKRWLESGKVVAVGSDLHGTDEKRYISFAEATYRLGEYAEAVESSMLELLSGAETLHID